MFNNRTRKGDSNKQTEKQHAGMKIALTKSLNEYFAAPKLKPHALKACLKFTQAQAFPLIEYRF